MIIYGSKAIHLKSVQSETATCPSCKKRGTLVFSVFSKHAHVYWIPLFPIGKIGFSECQHCKNVLEDKEMPEGLRLEYEDLEKETKPRVWQFIGLIIITVLFFPWWHLFIKIKDFFG